MNFSKLTLEEKFGQMIMMGLDVYEIDNEIIKIIEDYKIGGIILYKKNYTSIESMINVVNKLKEINRKNNIPLFIAIDQENGCVNRFPKDIAPISSPYKQSKAQNLKIIDGINEITTYLLKSCGINMNFAPDLDINRSEKNKAVGSRSYGNNFEEVIKYGLPYMEKLKNNDIIPVIKHFPGHGSTNKDSHFVLPKIKDIKKLESEDIKVFENAIKNGADAVMNGHLVLKGYGFKPVTLNKKIVDAYLKNKYNFKGLIVTDDLRMNILKYIYGIKKSVKYSVEAGHDIIMIKYKKGDYKKVYKKLLNMVKFCEIDPEIINFSAKKIISIKRKYKINDNSVNPKLELKLINKKIENINNLIDKTLKII